MKANLKLRLLKVNKNMIDVKMEIKRFLRTARKFEEIKRVKFIILFGSAT